MRKLRVGVRLNKVSIADKYWITGLLFLVLTFSKQQFASFGEINRAKWIVSAAQKLHSTYSGHYKSQGITPEDLIPVVTEVTNWGLRHDIESEADMTRLTLIAASLGHRFWQDPRFSHLAESSLAEKVLPSRRALRLTKDVKTWLQTIWANDAKSNFGTRLGSGIEAGHWPDLDTLHYILPGHGHALSDGTAVLFVDWLVAQIPATYRASPPHALAFCACALVQGTAWLSDPQLPRLQAIMQPETAPKDLAAKLVAHYSVAVQS